MQPGTLAASSVQDGRGRAELRELLSRTSRTTAPTSAATPLRLPEHLGPVGVRRDAGRGRAAALPAPPRCLHGQRAPGGGRPDRPVRALVLRRGEGRPRTSLASSRSSVASSRASTPTSPPSGPSATRPGPGGGPDPLIYDEPTWVWSRGRHEPYFGDGQAAIRASSGHQRRPRGRGSGPAPGLANEGRMTLVEERLAGRSTSSQEAAAWALDQQRAFPCARARPAPSRSLRARRAC